jgi:hypothetical protein
MQRGALFASSEGALFERLECFRRFNRNWLARIAHLLIAIIALSLLGACSGMRIVDSQVVAFSKLEALPVASSWRFERLPSQQNLGEKLALRQIQLETMAALALAKYGFKPQPETAGAVAKYSVQLGARIQRRVHGPLERGPFGAGYEPWGGHGYGYGSAYGHRPLGGFPGRDYVVTGQGRVIYLPLFPHLPPPWYVREVSLVIRDTSSNMVVYETKAQHDGRWADDEVVWPAMLAAALQGFPKPPQGKRMVSIEIPG